MSMSGFERSALLEWLPEPLYDRLRRLDRRRRQALVALKFVRPRRIILRDGTVILVDPRKGWIDWNLAAYGHYEQGTLLLVRKLLEPGGVFYDVGANIGIMSVSAARVLAGTGYVFSFEPDTANFTRLIYARDQNHVDNLIPLPLALGSIAGTAVLSRSPDADGGLSTLRKKDKFTPTAAVRTTTMDLITETLGVERVDVVKVDVEGFEEEVILGGVQMLRKFKPVVIMEMVNEESCRAGEKLLDIGYEPFCSSGKSQPEANILIKSSPRVLHNDNMIFIHESKFMDIQARGFEIQT